MSAYAEAMALARSEAVRGACAVLREEASRMRAAPCAEGSPARRENLAAAVALCHAAERIERGEGARERQR